VASLGGRRSAGVLQREQGRLSQAFGAGIPLDAWFAVAIVAGVVVVAWPWIVRAVRRSARM
jgi:hypothetical protein